MIIDAQGTELRFDGKVVGKVTQYEIRDGVVEDIPHTPLNSKAVGHLPGLPEFGDIILTLYRDTNDPGQEAIADAIRDRGVKTCYLTLKDGRVYEFNAYGKAIPITGVIDNVNTSAVRLKIQRLFNQIA